MSDSIADMFTVIRNALNVSFKSVHFKYSNIKLEIAKILTNEGYISSYEVITNDLNKKTIKLNLKYTKENKPVIECIKRVSKPSKRIYLKKKFIYKVINGYGTLILSTSKGILTGKEARLKNVGGEVIGEVY